MPDRVHLLRLRLYLIVVLSFSVLKPEQTYSKNVTVLNKYELAVAITLLILIFYNIINKCKFHYKNLLLESKISCTKIALQLHINASVQ